MKVYADVLASGSYVVMSHASGDIDPGAADRVTQLYSCTGSPMYFRPHTEIESFINGSRSGRASLDLSTVDSADEVG